MSSNGSVKIVVSIINFKTAELTVQAVESVLADMAGINGHIVVVDNLSEDGSSEKIANWIKTNNTKTPVSLIQSKTNSGFSGGHNQVIGAEKGDFYLILNSDAVIRSGFMNEIISVALENPDAGLIASGLEDEDGTPQVSCFRFPSPKSELIRGAATGFITRLFSDHDVPLNTEPDPSSIEWVSFACVLARREMIECIGLMDEGYFLYYEDIEYCWRANRNGWKVIYVPKARAIHFRGGSAPVKKLAKKNKRLPAYFYASRTRFFYQSCGWSGLVLANVYWHFGRLIAFSRKLIGKPVPKANKAEWRDIWTNLMSPLKTWNSNRD